MWPDLTLLIYIVARMSGFILCDPILGRRNIPGMFRSGLILVLSVYVYPAVADQTVAVPLGIPDFSIHVLQELLVGFILGMVVHFFLYIPHMAGFMVDTQMGMTMNQIYDAGMQGNMSVSGQVLNVLMLLLFFAANGHHTLLQIILTSGEIVEYGGVAIKDSVFDAALMMFVECTILGLKLCMPILAAELIGQLGMGLLMKAIPQINVFSINIELKVLIGLILLFVLTAPFSEFLLKAEMQMLNDMRQLLQLMA